MQKCSCRRPIFFPSAGHKTVLWQATFWHPDNMPCPLFSNVEWCLKWCWGCWLSQDTSTGLSILPADPSDLMNMLFVVLLQGFQMSLIGGPTFSLKNTDDKSTASETNNLVLILISQNLMTLFIHLMKAPYMSYASSLLFRLFYKKVTKCHHLTLVLLFL